MSLCLCVNIAAISNIVNNALPLNVYGSIVINLTSHYKAFRRVTVDRRRPQRYSQNNKIGAIAGVTPDSDQLCHLLCQQYEASEHDIRDGGFFAFFSSGRTFVTFGVHHGPVWDHTFHFHTFF